MKHSEPEMPLVNADRNQHDRQRTSFRLKRISLGSAVAVISFVSLGTVSALWENPFFIRMTPAGGWEIALLAVLSVLLGAYMAVRRPICSMKSAGAGGLLGFLGVACPVCNKVLLLLFGGELLLTYFEPIRIYVAAAGVTIVLLVLLRECRILFGGIGISKRRDGPPDGETAHGAR